MTDKPSLSAQERNRIVQALCDRLIRTGGYHDQYLVIQVSDIKTETGKLLAEEFPERGLGSCPESSDEELTATG